MENAINVTPSLAEGITALDAARANVVKAAKGTGEVIQGYADALCNVFGTEWYELKGKARKPIKAEREKFVAAMTEAGFQAGTINVYWQRVKEASGYVTVGNRVKGNSTCDDKTIADLKTIINRIVACEEDEEPRAAEHKRALMDIYEDLSGKEYAEK